MTREDAHNGCPDGGYLAWHETQEFITKIYDDFESRVCENCKHFTNTYYTLGACKKDVFIVGEDDNEFVSKDFGCNKFSAETH